MADLVPIPWQRHLYLTPSTLDLLDRASTFYGDDLYLNDYQWRTISPAWRSYKQQKTAYDKFRAGKGPVASNPDTGQRNHMRGAGFDLKLTTARAQQACRRAGLIRDPHEPWHWNDPDWASMPIIKTRTAGITVNVLPRGDIPMRIILNKDEKNDDLKRILVGETTWVRITKGRSLWERNLWGTPVKLSASQTRAEHSQVNTRRKQNNLPPVAF